MNKITTLSDIDIGASARVKSLHANGSIRRRLLDLGMIPGTRIECLQRSPAGDPTAYFVRGAVIALRKEDASMIHVL